MSSGTLLMAGPVAVGTNFVKIDLLGQKVELILYPTPSPDIIYLARNPQGAAATHFRISGTALTLTMDGAKGDVWLIATAAAQTCNVMIKEII